MTVTQFNYLSDFLDLNGKYFSLNAYTKTITSFFKGTKIKNTIIICGFNQFQEIKESEWYKKLHNDTDYRHLMVYTFQDESPQQKDFLIMTYEPNDDSINFKIKVV